MATQVWGNLARILSMRREKNKNVVFVFQRCLCEVITFLGSFLSPIIKRN